MVPFLYGSENSANQVSEWTVVVEMTSCWLGELNNAKEGDPRV